MWIPRAVKELPYYYNIKPLLIALFGPFTVGLICAVWGLMISRWPLIAGGCGAMLGLPFVLFLLWRDARDGRYYGELRKTRQRQ